MFSGMLLSYSSVDHEIMPIAFVIELPQSDDAKWAPDKTKDNET